MIKIKSKDIKKNKSKSAKRYSPPAVEQAGKILFCLANSSSVQMGLKEICNEVNVSGSKAFGILEALRKSGLIKRGDDGRGYSLGPALLTLSRKFLDDLVPSKIAEPILEKLTMKTERTSVLGLIISERVYVAAKHEHKGNIRVAMRIGQILPLTFGAHGKAIMAFLPEAERRQILREEDFYFHRKPHKFDISSMAEELARCRRDGFACDFEEYVEGVNAVAAPVFGATGIPIGFVEIFDLGSPEHARELGPFVVEAGRALSREMGANVD